MARDGRSFGTTTDSNQAGRWRRTCCPAVRRPAPNRVWLADITYMPTDEGWLYLAVVMDLYPQGGRLGDGATMEELRWRRCAWRSQPAADAGLLPQGSRQPVCRHD